MFKLKQTISFVLALVISVTSFAILSRTTIYAETVKIGLIDDSNVNIRKDASTSTSSLAKVTMWTVKIIGTKNDTSSTKNPATNKTYVWYKVTYTSNGSTVTGYVREDLIKVKEYKLDAEFSKKLSAFPESYHDDLILLHAIYPNWEFEANKTAESFKTSVAIQDDKFRKLVQTTYKSWYSMRKGCYSWSDNKFIETDSGGWYGASREVIAYYMDPRNFLNANDIYLFMQQSYNSKIQTLAGVEEIIKGTFLDDEINDESDAYNGKRFAQVIIDAAKSSNVNPYILASTIIQEQGTKGATLSKGTTYNKKTVYNFFNFKASGSSSDEIIKNGAKYAYEQEWFTRSASIIGGAKKYGNDYTDEGQDTYFYKNFNVLNGEEDAWHQYAQNIQDSLSSSRKLKNMYAGQDSVKLTFRIPVYSSLPSSISKLPAKNSKLNNYYFSDIEADGLTPSFNRYTYEYSLSTDSNINVYVKVPSGASITSADTFSLKKGSNEVKLVVKSQTGYTNTYIINVDAQKACKLYVNDGSSPESSNVKKGDTNGDGKITTSDLANVRLHLLELIELKNDNLKGADTNGDGKITTSDLANIRLHLLELITLK